MLLAALLIVCPTTLHATPFKLLAVGDSLTEEYRFETPFSAPDSSPFSANTQNWVEILHQQRPAQFTMGGYSSSLGAYADFRNGGYEYNYGVPGFTAERWRRILYPSFSDLLTVEGAIGEVTRTELNSDLAAIDAVLIFLGGNDLKTNFSSIYFDAIPPALLSQIPTRLEAIHTYLRHRSPPNTPILLCTVPDIAASPDIFLKPEYSDPALKLRARQRVAAMNQTIIQFAESQPHTQIVRIDFLSDDLYELDPFHLNGTTFTYYQLPEGLENPPLHLFCKDGFHPGTMLHARIANLILAAINQVAVTPIPPLTNREILSEILTQNPEQPYIDWALANNLSPEIPHQHLVEYLLDQHPIQTHPDRTLTYTPSETALRYATLTTHESPTLSNFQPVPENRIHPLPQNTLQITPPPNAPRNFYQLQATPKP